MSIKLMTLSWDLDMQPTNKLVLLALCDWANDEGLCFPSVSSIARRACLSERQSQRVMQTLVAARWIDVVGNENGGRSSRRYRINVNALRRGDTGDRGDTGVRGDNLTPPTPTSPLGRHSRRPSGDINDAPGVSQLSPEPSFDPSNEPSTKPIGADGLVWPSPLMKKDAVVVRSLIECLSPELQQLVLDEMQGAFDQGNPPKDVRRWTKAVVGLARRGELAPKRALQVARRRHTRAQEAAEAMARQELSRKLARAKTPEELARRRARVDEAAAELNR
ncbi:helix-turn-helix domain-containing protein [Lysobacter stagni]|uniref:helix-turn-helix domain-containing protein n=1 Tax=Lysobacter stagni TaxID=3045172 RepID=UPI003D777265